jgi:hypothetical protein
MKDLPTTEQDLVMATVAWDACCQTINRTKAERGAVMCEHECPRFDDLGEDDERDGIFVSAPKEPCWKPIGHDEDGRPIYSPQSEWCESCRRRQAIHEQWRAAKKSHGPLLRRVRMLARRCMKLTETLEQIARDTQ